MTGLQSMEIISRNTQSGSYERPGSSNLEDYFIIGDIIETSLIPTNTLKSNVTITYGS